MLIKFDVLSYKHIFIGMVYMEVDSLIKLGHTFTSITNNYESVLNSLFIIAPMHQIILHLSLIIQQRTTFHLK